MASLAKRASKSRTAWIVGLAAAAVAVIGGVVYASEKGASASPASPPGPPSNLVQPNLTAPALTGTTTTPSGTLAIGNMGSVTLHTSVGAPLVGISFAPPSTGGGSIAPVITNMTSSNQAVTQNLTYSGGVSGLALGVDALGTTTLTFTWLDTTGATQTSTLTLNVVTP